MNILVANQKGGVGKSTLAVLLANFITLAKQYPATIIDMDDQQSISQKYEKAKILENAQPYDVIPATLDSYPILREGLSRNKKGVILIDLPHKLDDERLIPVFNSAALVLCPFAYEEFIFDSTVLFAVVLRKINPDAAIVFVPNRVKANAMLEIMAGINEQLSRFGKITAALADRVDFQRITTFQTPASIAGVVAPVLEQIFTDHISGKT